MEGSNLCDSDEESWICDALTSGKGDCDWLTLRWDTSGVEGLDVLNATFEYEKKSLFAFTLLLSVSLPAATAISLRGNKQVTDCGLQRKLLRQNPLRHQ